jgi:hypothetical protein
VRGCGNESVRGCVCSCGGGWVGGGRDKAHVADRCVYAAKVGVCVRVRGGGG